MARSECSYPLVNASLHQLAENLYNARYYIFYLLACVVVSMALDLGHTLTNDFKLHKRFQSP